MSARIRELEEVLRQMHSEKSDLPHPLLADSITVISHDSPESPLSSNSPEQPPLLSNKDNPDSVIDAFGEAFQPSASHLWLSIFVGTLTIGTRGETIFMSGTARSEVSPESIIMNYALNILVVSHSGALGCDCLLTMLIRPLFSHL
jgi:hypothetical protein